MKTVQRVLFAATLLTIFSTSVMARDVTIIYTSDPHIRVDSYKAPYAADGKHDIDDFANISTLIKQEKVKNKVVFYFDAGDYLTGPYISSLTKSEIIIDIMSVMPFGAVSIGNHELDHGWDSALRQLSKASFPALLGNIYYKESEKPLWNKPYTILGKDGVRIGIVGLHGVFAFNNTVSEFSLQGPDNDNNNRFNKSSTTLKNQGTEARDEVRHLQRYIDELRDKVDLTVALVHEGISARRSSTGNTDARRALDKDIQTASRVKGLDILTTGYAHIGMPEPIKVGNTLIFSTDSGGIDIGKLILDANPTTHTHRVESFELKTACVDK